MTIEFIGTVFFGCAILHTFLTAPFRKMAEIYPAASWQYGCLHFLGEIEVVFGLWALMLLVAFCAMEGVSPAIGYLESVSFTEPLFVFVVMAICSTRPILDAARALIVFVSRGLVRFFGTSEIGTEVFVILFIGPLLGSFITEPAAMTVSALLLFSMIHTRRKAPLYALLGVLFVNISVGGAMTPYAAPPILMVAEAWDWDLAYIFQAFGWKVILITLINSLGYVLIFRHDLKEGFTTLKALDKHEDRQRENIPWMVIALHFVFLIAVILFAHYERVFLGLFVFFLGLYSITKYHQQHLRLKESLLVGFFLAGIVLFGPFQRWWLQPLLSTWGSGALFIGATGLTAITDNAALTFLGSQVPNLPEMSRWALVAGALAGGGLTIIANAPNPAGSAILQSKFPEHRISPFLLLAGAVVPTFIAVSLFWFLPR